MRGGGAGVRFLSPRVWYLVFTRRTAVWWWRLLPGRFKHVSCIAAVPEIGGWIVVDPAYDRTDVAVVPDDSVDAVFLALSQPGTEIVRMPVLGGPSRIPRWGMWCTALAGHLVGLSPCALRPDGLLRQCLANGGELIHGTDEGPERGDGTPEDGRTARQGRAGQDDTEGSATADS